MKASKALIEKIKEFEGLRLRAYKPVLTEKNWTIGYGHSGADVGENMRITEDYASFLLGIDIARVEKQINALNLTFPQNRYDALVSFVFNVGMGNFKISTLYKKIRHGAPVPEVQKEFRRWVYANKKVLPGLVKRREYEASLWAME